jgi:hypothetical protein
LKAYLSYLRINFTSYTTTSKTSECRISNTCPSSIAPTLTRITTLLTPYRTPSRKPKRTPSQTPNSYPKTVPKHRHINIQYISPSIGNSWKLSHQSFDSFLMNCMRWATHLPRHPAQHLSHHLVQMPIQGIPTDKLRTTQNGNRPVTNNSINTKIRICLTSHNPNRQMPMHGHWCGPSYKSQTERRHAV